MPQSADTLAAIDLGSNSFHLLVARLENDQLQVLDRHKEMVRLAGGLDEANNLDPQTRARALACLRRFGQRLEGLPPQNVRIVGTNTLRRARNAADFIAEAEQAVGHEIEIISGREEARLIYLGVAHSLPSEPARRLVVDIGGGSTEVILGEGFDTRLRESLSMGCVSMTRRFFGDGRITAEAWQAAVTHAELALLPLIRPYTERGWAVAVGSSGTLRSVAQVQRALGWSEGGITARGLRRLRKALLAAGCSEALDLPGLSEERRPVFVGGAAIAYAVFEAFRLEHMGISAGALREGVVYDLAGRLHHADVRGRSIAHLVKTFRVDTDQVARVQQVMARLLALGEASLGLTDAERQLLDWAVQLHEVGRVVAHGRYHRHGAYLVRHADMPGFSRQEQERLALLIRLQRRRLGGKALHRLPARERGRLLRLALLLRVALVLRRDRRDAPVPLERVKWKDGQLKLRFASGWLEAHPLTAADLAREAERALAAGWRLKYA